MVNNKPLFTLNLITLQLIPKPQIKQLLLFCLMALLPLLGSCSRADADYLWQDYYERLARVFALAAELTPQSAAELAPVPPLPAIRDLYQQVPQSSLNLLDLVALRPCGLQQRVAERNNSLGKVMSPANQLGYELQLVHELKPCLQHPELSKDLQAKLTAIYQQKQQQLVIVLDNFLLTDLTLRQQLQGSQRSIKAGTNISVTDTQTALTALADLRQKLLRFDDQSIASTDAKVINSLVAQLYQSQVLADWQYSLRLNLAWISAINNQLEQVDIAKFCSSSQAKSKTDILQTILLQRFIQKIQPYLAEIDGISHQLQPALNNLYQQSAMAGVLYQRTEAQSNALKDEVKKHVFWWQQLQQHCSVKITPDKN
jgi:hypothetical protein